MKRLISLDLFFSSYNSNVSSFFSPYKIFNMCNYKYTKLFDFTTCLAKKFNKEAIKEIFPINQEESPNALYDNKFLNKLIDSSPNTSLIIGIHIFVKWYKKYY